MGGGDVLMMVHHSRDTDAKQWNETWVLTLSSSARIFRAFLPGDDEMPPFCATFSASSEAPEAIARLDPDAPFFFLLAWDVAAAAGMMLPKKSRITLPP